MSAVPSLQFPAKLAFLFKPSRYKVLHGGRGGAKSWSIARALLVQGASRPLRVGCFREIQKSIKESVHQLLKDQIDALGLSHFYKALETEIRGANGTLFIFAGLQGHTVLSIKSFEGLDVAWVEEAQTVRGKSWNVLILTIRKEGSEIWVSMNPELETDDSYVRFIENPPPDATVAQINFSDNPWFPETLEKERRHAKATMKPDDYGNVWGGRCRSAVQGAIYADEIAEAIAGGRITLLPYEPRLRVHVVMDLGWNDSMFMVLAQRHLSSLRIIEAIEVNHKTLDWVSGELKTRRYNWGTMFLPHDGTHGDFKTGKSTRQIMQEKGWTVSIVPNIPIETGIKRGREVFPLAYFDKVKAAPLINALKRYRRNVDSRHDEANTPVHDAASHGGDAWRYTSLVVEKMTNASDVVHIPRNAVVSYEVDAETGM